MAATLSLAQDKSSGPAVNVTNTTGLLSGAIIKTLVAIPVDSKLKFHTRTDIVLEKITMQVLCLISKSFECKDC